MVSFDNCDSLTPTNGGWGVGGSGSPTVTLDTVEKYEGTGSILLTADATKYSCYAFKAKPGEVWDWSQTPLLKTWLYASIDMSSRVVIITNEGGWKEYYFPITPNLTATTWTDIEFDLTTQIDSTGLQGIKQIRYEIFQNNQAATLNVDDIRLETSESYWTLQIAPYSNGSITRNGVYVPQSGGTYQYSPDAEVTLIATPSYGGTFTKWVYDSSESSNTTLELTMTQDYMVTATFGAGEPPPQPPSTHLYVDGKYVKDPEDNIVFLRGAWIPIFEDTCNARAALTGETWNSWLSTTTWRPNACNFMLDTARSWGMNFISTFMWCDWWIFNSRTTLGYSRNEIWTDRPYQQNIAEFLDLAEAKGVYIELRPYGVEAGFAGVGEGRVNFPFPVAGESYCHNGSIFADETAFVNFWGDVASKLAHKVNVIFCLYDEPIISYSKVQTWFSAAAAAIIKIRQVETAAEGVQHLIHLHWGFNGSLSWIEDWLTYAAGRGDVPLTNIIYSGHVYRNQGNSPTEETFGPAPYPTDPDVQKAILQYKANDDNIPDPYKPYGRAYKYIQDTYNIPLVNTIGAYTGYTDDDEYNMFVNVLSIFNDWEMGYHNYVGWRTGMVWSNVETAPVPSPPNRVGLALMNAIAGAPPPPTPTNATVTGTVYGPDTSPLANVNVTTSIYSTTTNESGFYSLSLPINRNYTISFAKTGYITGSLSRYVTDDSDDNNITLTEQPAPSGALNTIGLGGNLPLPTNGKTYVVQGTNILVTSSGMATINIYDSQGILLETSNELQNRFFPVGYKIQWNYTVTPTVKVVAIQ